MDSYCLITGAANGLGLEFAKRFFVEGYGLVLVDKDFKKLQDLKIEFNNQGKKSVCIIAQDLCDVDSALMVYNAVAKMNLKIEVLINNAGFGIYGEFAKISTEKLLDLVKLSVLTTTHLTRLFLKDMIDVGKGRILLVSSLAAFQPAPLMSVYAASKIYLLYLGEALANETEETNVSVTVLCPGVISTGFQKATGNLNPKIPWNISTPEKVADYGYRALFKKKVVAIPGFENKVLAQLHRIFPRKLTTAIVKKVHKINREQQ